MAHAKAQTCKKIWWGWEQLAKPLPSCLLSGWIPLGYTGLARFMPPESSHNESQFYTSFGQNPLQYFWFSLGLQCREGGGGRKGFFFPFCIW